MTIIERLWEALDEKSRRMADLSAILRVNSSTIGNWKTRNTDPPAKYIAPICEFLNISTTWLLTGEGEMHRNADNVNPLDMRLLNDFNRLSEKEKSLVLERIQSFLDLKTQASKPDKAVTPKKPVKVLEIEIPKIEIRIYDERASAGLGNYLCGDSTYEMMSFDESVVPPEADMGIRITGNSMEPDIPDKSIVWVKEMHEIQNGQVGIFVLNNEEAFCKKLKIDHDKREVYLVSINPKYKPMKISEDDFLRTIGKVIGKPFF